MSDALYSTRLRFQAGAGIAKLRGAFVRISRAPDLPGVRVVAIDYVPEIHLAMVQPYADAWRDMTADEVRAADALLVELTKGAA